MTNWVVFGASVKGTSHVRSGTPCQDDWFGATQELGDLSVSIGVASDGAGSASRSHEGAGRAVETVARVFDEQVSTLSSAEMGVAVVQAAFEEAHAALTETDPLSARDLACTLLVLLASSDGWFVAGQIGDGAIATSSESGVAVIIDAIHGEFANQTVFLTQPNALSLVRIAAVQEHLRWGGLCTDGVETIAIDAVSGRPHEPFFEPFLKALEKFPRDLSDEHQHVLEAALQKFLESSDVNTRIDDDKTLVLVSDRGRERRPVIGPSSRAGQRIGDFAPCPTDP